MKTKVSANVTPLTVGPAKLARLLDISERTLATLTADGVIPSIKLGNRRLYIIADVQEWLSQKSRQQLAGVGSTE